MASVIGHLCGRRADENLFYGEFYVDFVPGSDLSIHRGVSNISRAIAMTPLFLELLLLRLLTSYIAKYSIFRETDCIRG